MPRRPTHRQQNRRWRRLLRLRKKLVYIQRVHYHNSVNRYGVCVYCRRQVRR